MPSFIFIPGMCFPGKRQKDAFAEPKPTPTDTKAHPASSDPSSYTPVSSAAPHYYSPPSFVSPNNASNHKMSSGPRVAIIIYSLYGHIAKRSSFVSLSLLALDVLTSDMNTSR